MLDGRHSRTQLRVVLRADDHRGPPPRPVRPVGPRRQFGQTVGEIVTASSLLKSGLPDPSLRRVPTTRKASPCLRASKSGPLVGPGTAGTTRASGAGRCSRSARAPGNLHRVRRPGRPSCVTAEIKWTSYPRSGGRPGDHVSHLAAVRGCPPVQGDDPRTFGRSGSNATSSPSMTSGPRSDRAASRRSRNRSHGTRIRTAALDVAQELIAPRPLPSLAPGIRPGTSATVKVVPAMGTTPDAASAW